MKVTSLLAGLSKTESKKAAAVFEFGREYLSDTFRRSGEDYFQHGWEVAMVLKEGVDDPSLLRAALLHDVLVVENGESLLRRSPLTDDERHLVREMYDLRRLHVDENTKDLDTLIEAFAGDPRLLPLRMAHRLNDIRHLDRFKASLRKQIAHEALHMYTSIAGRLGLHVWRYEMEDLCFEIVQPTLYKKIHSQFSAVAALDDMCLSHTEKFLKKNLRAEKIDAIFDRRIKGHYSTYRKMVLKNRRFEELTDRLALRIVVPDIKECYRALGVVHAFMHPIPGKLKDYIGAPKENGYQSIHTVVYPLPGVTEQPIEIQIRSTKMHRLCEFGAASHGDYKDSMYTLKAHPARVDLFRNLENLREEIRSPKQFEDALRKYFREDQMAIFDEENNLYHLKKPATVLDFLHHAYPARWMKTKTVRLNGRKVSLDQELHDGDIVQANFGRSSAVQNSWKHACRHARVKKALREAIAAR